MFIKVYVPKPSPEDRGLYLNKILPQHSCTLSQSQINRLIKVTKGKTFQELFEDIHEITEAIRHEVLENSYFKQIYLNGKEMNRPCHSYHRYSTRNCDLKQKRLYALYFSDLVEAFTKRIKTENDVNDQKMIDFVMANQLVHKSSEPEPKTSYCFIC